MSEMSASEVSMSEISISELYAFEFSMSEMSACEMLRRPFMSNLQRLSRRSISASSCGGKCRQELVDSIMLASSHWTNSVLDMGRKPVV